MPVIEWCTKLSGLGDFKKKHPYLSQFTCRIHCTRVCEWGAGRAGASPPKVLEGELSPPNFRRLQSVAVGQTLKKYASCCSYGIRNSMTCN